jgi:hypothetical protein
MHASAFCLDLQSYRRFTINGMISKFCYVITKFDLTFTNVRAWIVIKRDPRVSKVLPSYNTKSTFLLFASINVDLFLF